MVRFLFLIRLFCLSYGHVVHVFFFFNFILKSDIYIMVDLCVVE